MERLITIGKVALRAGVNVQTVRYYERVGLVEPITRKESGYRLYDPEAVKRIGFIKHAQKLGFSLNEIEVLLRLQVIDVKSCDEVRTKVEERLRDVRRMMTQLKRMEKVLTELVHSCLYRKKTDPCPILRSLKEDADKDSIWVQDGVPDKGAENGAVGRKGGWL